MVNASRKSRPDCFGSSTETTKAMASASSVLRVRAFTQVSLQPVENGSPPDAPVARTQHPVSLIGEIQELGVEAHSLGCGERLVAFGQVDAVIELSVDHEQRRLPVA